jgi:hypothetical protein
MKKKFILGYASAELDLIPENLTEYPDEKTADYETEEWVIVEADTLQEAKDKYEETFVAWQKAQYGNSLGSPYR